MRSRSITDTEVLLNKRMRAVFNGTQQIEVTNETPVWGAIDVEVNDEGEFTNFVVRATTRVGDRTQSVVEMRLARKYVVDMARAILMEDERR